MISIRTIALADAYAIVALAFGLFLVVVTPPFGVGDETAHFERAYEVASGQFLGADGLPAGMQAFIDDAFGRVKSGEPIKATDFSRWAALDLDDATTTPYPDPIRKVLRLHSPLCYAHLAPVIAVGVAVGMPPLAIFYALRLTALIVGIALVWSALRRVPEMLRPTLIFLALLPTAVVFFAGVNIESVLVGLGFYYFALIAGHAAEQERRLTTADVVRLAAIAFMLGQFKSGYILLPAIALLLPPTKFESARARAMILSLIILPGAGASLVWALVVKQAMLGGVVYSTANGNHVEPAAQLAQIIADPISFAAIVLRTIFASDAPAFAWKSFLALGGWTNIPVSGAIYALLTIGVLLVWLSGEPPPRTLGTPLATTIQIAIFCVTSLIILTLVYLQWNGVGDPLIAGFQGRYLLAATPLLAALAPIRLSLLSPSGRREALAFGVPAIGLVAMAAAIVDRYYS